MYYDFIKNQFCENHFDGNKLAVAGSDVDLTWNELVQCTNEITAQLDSLKIAPGHPIIIYGHKQANYVASILACYKAKVTYIPIDTIYPVERIKSIQQQTASQIIIDCTGTFVNNEFPVVVIPCQKIRIHHHPHFENQSYTDTQDPLQYIMFTSGSTGKPKGVMIRRSSVIEFLSWANNTFGIKNDDVLMNQAPFSFDVSLCDFLLALSNGASLVLNTREDSNNPETFFSRLKKYQCSVWTSTPSFAFIFLRIPEFNDQHIPSLRHFLFMGEILPVKTCSILFDKFQACSIANAYGPTEATIVTTHIFVTKEMLQKYNVLPIGYAINDNALSIKKDHPEAEYGELFISGKHVAAGYYREKELTEKKFFVLNGQTTFKSGDLAKEENGLWFFGGRNDDQIKLHGFRIELDEISAVLQQFSAIEMACTIALKRNNEVKKLISFVTLKNGIKLAVVDFELKEFLNKKLPYYMQPSEVLELNEFPTSVSHKIDKNKLLNNYLSNLQ